MAVEVCTQTSVSYIRPFNGWTVQSEIKQGYSYTGQKFGIIQII